MLALLLATHAVGQVSLQPWYSYAIPAVSLVGRSAVLGDVDADGVRDFALRRGRLILGGTAWAFTVDLYSGRDGTVLRSWPGLAAAQLPDTPPGDLDGDGIDDLVFIGGDEVVAYSVALGRELYRIRLAASYNRTASAVAGLGDPRRRRQR